MRTMKVLVAMFGSCLFVSQLEAQQVWTLSDPPANTFRTKGSRVIGAGMGWTGSQAKFKFGTTMQTPGGVVVLIGENEVVVNVVAIMQGMPMGQWQTTTSELSAPNGGWNVSPLGPMPGMRAPDHVAGIVISTANVDQLEGNTVGHTVNP